MGSDAVHQTVRRNDKMADTTVSRVTSRRELLKTTGYVAGASLVSSILPKGTLASAFAQQSQPAAQAAGQAGSPFGPDFVAKMRAQMGTVPLQTLKLRDNIYMLYGPGGNMVALNGPDGKVLVDSSFSTVVPKIKEALEGLGSAPLKIV